MSDNEQFDKLIKEKVDGKSYPYSASSWHSFKSKAGLKSTLSIVHSVLIGAASVAVVGVGCYLGYRHFQSQPNSVLPDAPVATSTDSTLISDDLCPNTPDEVTTDSVVEVSQPVITISDKKTSPVRPNAEKKSNPTTAPADTIQTVSAKKQPILRQRHNRRILEINTDTIKSND